MKISSRQSLFGTLILLVCVGLVMWLWGEGDIHDLGLNFFTTMLGTCVTVFLVDYLIKRGAEKRAVPIKIIIYQECSLLMNKLLSMIFDIYSKSVEAPLPKSTEEFLLSGGIEQTFLNTDSEAMAHTLPPQKLVSYIASEGKDIEDQAEKIIDQYSSFLEPQQALLIHKCFRESVFVTMLKSIPRTIQSRQEWPYPKSLIYHMFTPSKEDINDLISLYQLLERQRIVLIKKEEGIRLLSNPIGYNVSNRKLIYQLPEIDLENQVKIFNEWVEKSRSASNK